MGNKDNDAVVSIKQRPKKPWSDNTPENAKVQWQSGYSYRLCLEANAAAETKGVCVCCHAPNKK